MRLASWRCDLTPIVQGRIASDVEHASGGSSTLDRCALPAPSESASGIGCTTLTRTPGYALFAISACKRTL